MARSLILELVVPAAALFAAHLAVAALGPDVALRAILASALLSCAALVRPGGSAGRGAADLKLPGVTPRPPRLPQDPGAFVEDSRALAVRASRWGRWCSGCWPFCVKSPTPLPARTAGGAARLPAAGHRREVSAKFCGWRYTPASAVAAAPASDALVLPPPRCEAFPAFGDAPWPADAPWHATWDAKLRWDDRERRLCEELRAALSDAAGPKDPVTMLRFLRARGRSVVAAARMYREAMARRLGPGYEQAFREGSVDDSLHRRLDPYWKPFGLLGFDRDGDPIFWERIGIIDVDAFGRMPHDFVVRHEAYNFARLLQAMEELSRAVDRPVVYFTAVEDLTGLGLHMLAPRGLVNYKTIVRICEEEYPELVKRALVIKAPGVFEKVWRFVSRFFDDGTREKIQFIREADTLATLSKYIAPEWIPECYGGRLRLGSSSECEPVLYCSQPRRVPEELMQEILATWGEVTSSTCRS